MTEDRRIVSSEFSSNIFTDFSELELYSNVLNISQEFTAISAIPPPLSISLKIHICPLFPASSELSGFLLFVPFQSKAAESQAPEP